ncbi:MAG TPA: hypothetical protein DCW90_06330 [Lachnospiraceae bacterium]|nr:dUTPase [uncultured Lachnoclostridium sp.]HAU85115.1 hypothetical protein [Lachnospiraceae bacterium]
MTTNVFDVMLQKQKELQLRLGMDLDNFTPKERAAFVKEFSLWAIDEYSEMLHELPYAKGWSKKYDKPDYDHEKQYQLCKEEFIDVLTFSMSVAAALGFTGEEMERMYLEKNGVNHKRQDNNY